MARGKVKADNRADTRGGGFTGLPHVVHDSAAYRHLSLWGRAVLLEVLRRSNGYNNGSIAVSQRELADALATTNYRKVGAAIAELMQHGLLDVAADGAWKERQARQYRLTFISTGNHNHYAPATNEYLHWSPGVKSGDDAASAGKGQSDDTASAERRKLDDAASARIAANRRKSANPENRPADTASSLISKPYPSGTIVGAEGGNGDHQTPSISPSPAAAPRFDPETEATARDVRAALAARGSIAQAEIAHGSGVRPDRLQRFIDGSDGLSPPLIMLVRRELNRRERSAAA